MRSTARRRRPRSALLEAMEERQVSVDGETRLLPVPFMVAATMNPIEYEGTYTLPEAQLDRFLMKLVLGLPERVDEIEVLTRHAAGFNPRDLKAAGVTPVLDAAKLAAGAGGGSRRSARARTSLGYAVDLARATRQSPSVKLGVSPRGTTALLAASKAWAWLKRFRCDHAPTTSRPWRCPCSGTASSCGRRPKLEGVSADTILRGILQQVQVPI